MSTTNTPRIKQRETALWEVCMVGAFGGIFPSLLKYGLGLSNGSLAPPDIFAVKIFLALIIFAFLGAGLGFVYRERQLPKAFLLGLSLPSFVTSLSADLRGMPRSVKAQSLQVTSTQDSGIAVEIPSGCMSDVRLIFMDQSNRDLSVIHDISPQQSIPVPRSSGSFRIESARCASDAVEIHPGSGTFFYYFGEESDGFRFTLGLVRKAERLFVRHFQQVAGAATDVGVGANGSVVIVGTAPCDPNGCGIYRYDGANFRQIGGSAVRVAVDPAGNPWVVNQFGGIFRLVGNQFQQVAGTAKDVAVGANGSVFVIGTAPCDANGCGIYRFNGNTFQRIEGSAVRIAVDPTGNPWIVNRSGGIWRLAGGHFQQVEGAAATDVSVGANGSVFVVGTAPCDSNGCGIYRLNGNTFQRIEGSAVDIAIDPEGKPWAINHQGEIWRMM